MERETRLELATSTLIRLCSRSPYLELVSHPISRLNRLLNSAQSEQQGPIRATTVSDAEYAAALTAGRTESETEIRAQAVRYVPERDAIEIVTNRNAGFLIPRQWIGALQDVRTDELRKLSVWPDGSAIELEDRDVHIGVHGLLTAILTGDAALANSCCHLCKPRRPSDLARKANQLESQRSQRRSTSKEDGGRRKVTSGTARHKGR